MIQQKKPVLILSTGFFALCMSTYFFEHGEAMLRAQKNTEHAYKKIL